MEKRAMTSAERKQNERRRKLERMSEDEKKEHRIQENKRRCELRKKQLQNMTKEQLGEYQRKDRDRKKKKVLLDKSLNESAETIPIEEESPYRSRQSMGKALKRGFNALPYSPRKKQAVVRGLAAKVGIKLDNASQKGTRWSVTKELEDEVKKFYLREDISYTMPGKIFLFNINEVLEYAAFISSLQ